MNQSRFIATSLKEVAAFFGVQQETIRTWISRGCPAEVGTSPDGGRYDLSTMTQWARKNVWMPRQNGSGTASDNGESELKRKILQIEYTERAMGLKKRLGELVERQAVLVEMSQQNTVIRNRLEAIPAEAVSAIPVGMRSEVITDWERLIHRVLQELERHAHEDPQNTDHERHGSDPV